jgi:acetoin utilization protein AcuB
VFEVMSEGAKTVPATMPADEAWDLMRRRGIHHLVVTDRSEVVGVLSDRDVRTRDGDVRARRTAGELMTRPALTVRPSDTIRRVANLMRGRTIGCVPVLDGDRLVGIVTVSDLLELLGRGVDRPPKPARRGATHRVPHRKVRRPGRAW